MPTEAASQIANTRQDVARQAPVQPLTAAEAEARRNILADVEAQCASHGRHPAEWDVTKSAWVSPDEPAAPYAIITTSLAPPKRCREVICELLGAGLPVAHTAHQAVSNPVEQKRVVKAARKLVHALREGPGVAPHVTAAVSLGILQPSHRTFCMAVQQRVAKGEDADVAADAVAKEMPGAAGSVTMAVLEQWMASMMEAPYTEQLKAARQLQKGASAAGEAQLADTPAAIGSAAEKTAQYISGFYYQEVKQAKDRHAQGNLPQPVHDGAAKRKAPDDCGLPDLPPGCRWGYCTPDRVFVPLDPITRTMGSALPVAATDGTPTIATAGSAGQGTAAELKQLAHIYQPVLWAPDKAVLAERSWGLFSADNPGVERTEAASKEAAAAKNTAALRDLRVEHFGAMEARQLVRDVALVVQDRLAAGTFTPTGSAVKAREALKVKTLTLQLPDRDPGLEPPLERLLAMEFVAPPAKGGPSAKKHKL